MMKNIIYRKVLVPASQSEDGETPTVVSLTEEVNCFIVWFQSYEMGTKALRWFSISERDKAIESAVDLSRDMATTLEEVSKQELMNNGRGH